MNTYVIKSGDSFYSLAKQNGCSCQEIIESNPGVDPNNLQIGQTIRIPVGKSNVFNRCDDALVEIEGVRFRVTRMGEPSIPHEAHLILPRVEIRKVEHPMTGIIETTIMISNINIVNSPRFEGEGGDGGEGEQNSANQPEDTFSDNFAR